MATQRGLWKQIEEARTADELYEVRRAVDNSYVDINEYLKMQNAISRKEKELEGEN